MIKFRSESQPEYQDREREELEKLMGVRLPAAYLELMRQDNGGYLAESLEIPVPEPIPENLKYYLGDGFWGIHRIAGISTNPRNLEGLHYSYTTCREWDIPEKVVAFDGDGHTWVAFDFRGEVENPPIIFIETDDLKTHQLAKSFEEMLQKAIPYSSVYDSNGNRKT